ncbi:MAG: lytic transglycosylase domain-containing protein [Nanoarchaeota archaeon]|nr:lytic transglycosylase domain-containing protein [Nanoarchaeota archaeon]
MIKNKKAVSGLKSPLNFSPGFLHSKKAVSGLKAPCFFPRVLPEGEKAATQTSIILLIGMVVAVIIIITFIPIGKTFAEIVINTFSSDDDKVEVPEELEKDLTTLKLKYQPAEVPTSALENINKYEETINEAAREYGLDPNLIKAVIIKESWGQPYEVSTAGAVGLMQLMPDTAIELGVYVPPTYEKGDCVRGKEITCNIIADERFDPIKNIMAGSKYLADRIKDFGNVELALASYNWGPSRVKNNCGATFDTCKNLPEETANYVPKIMGYYNSLTA